MPSASRARQFSFSTRRYIHNRRRRGDFQRTDLHFNSITMDPARGWRDLHGHDRQPSVRLDDFHRSDRRETPLGQSGHPSNLHPLYPPRDLLVPFEAYLADRFGPRLLVLVGGVLIGFSWMLFSWANTLTVLYVGGMIGGVGTGLVYGTCIGNALKWFQARRGLAAGCDGGGLRSGRGAHGPAPDALFIGKRIRSDFLPLWLLQGIVVLARGAGAQEAVRTRGCPP